MKKNTWQSFLSKYLKDHETSSMSQTDKFKAAGKAYRSIKGTSKQGGGGNCWMSNAFGTPKSKSRRHRRRHQRGKTQRGGGCNGGCGGGAGGVPSVF